MADEPTRDGRSRWGWFGELDRILRGEATSLPALREGTIRVPGRGLTVVIIVLGAIYGFCMGWFALLNRELATALQQLVATMIKVPLLFFLTLLVTFPSLYIFNALVGSRLRLVALARLLIASIGVTMAVLASFGPIVAFFSLTTDSYPFMLLLNVALFAVAGFLGLGFLLQTLHRLTVALDLPGSRPAPEERVPAPPQAPEPLGEAPLLPDPDHPWSEPHPPARPGGALDRLSDHPVLGRHVKIVFQCWVIVFALVGAQMSWVLRPFLGDPSLPFEWFRGRESNFFEAVLRTLARLLG